MSNIKPLFLIGHKRSGTTLLGEVLSLNERVFVSRESDITWILYQFYNKIEIDKHPFDGALGLKKSMQLYGDTLDDSLSPWQNYLSFQKKIMEGGFLLREPQRKPDLQWVGDQKPFQSSDPRIVDFVSSHFPPGKFIHIIRHPYHVLQSCKAFGRNNDGGHMWKNLSPKEIERRWTKVETWVLDIKQKFPKSVIDIKYEDLTGSPKETLNTMLRFLNIDPSDQFFTTSLALIKNNVKVLKEYEFDIATKQIMSLYGYS